MIKSGFSYFIINMILAKICLKMRVKSFHQIQRRNIRFQEASIKLFAFVENMNFFLNNQEEKAIINGHKRRIPFMPKQGKTTGINQLIQRGVISHGTDLRDLQLKQHLSMGPHSMNGLFIQQDAIRTIATLFQDLYFLIIILRVRERN